MLGIMHLATTQGVHSGLVVLSPCIILQAMSSHKPSMPLDKSNRAQIQTSQSGESLTIQPSL